MAFPQNGSWDWNRAQEGGTVMGDRGKGGHRSGRGVEYNIWEENHHLYMDNLRLWDCLTLVRSEPSLGCQNAINLVFGLQENEYLISFPDTHQLMRTRFPNGMLYHNNAEETMLENSKLRDENARLHAAVWVLRDNPTLQADATVAAIFRLDEAQFQSKFHVEYDNLGTESLRSQDKAAYNTTSNKVVLASLDLGADHNMAIQLTNQPIQVGHASARRCRSASNRRHHGYRAPLSVIASRKRSGSALSQRNFTANWRPSPSMEGERFLGIPSEDMHVNLYAKRPPRAKKGKPHNRVRKFVSDDVISNTEGRLTSISSTEILSCKSDSLGQEHGAWTLVRSISYLQGQDRNNCHIADELDELDQDRNNCHIAGELGQDRNNSHIADELDELDQDRNNCHIAGELGQDRNNSHIADELDELIDCFLNCRQNFNENDPENMDMFWEEYARGNVNRNMKNDSQTSLNSPGISGTADAVNRMSITSAEPVQLPKLASVVSLHGSDVKPLGTDIAVAVESLEQRAHASRPLSAKKRDFKTARMVNLNKMAEILKAEKYELGNRNKSQIRSRNNSGKLSHNTNNKLTPSPSLEFILSDSNVSKPRQGYRRVSSFGVKISDMSKKNKIHFKGHHPSEVIEIKKDKDFISPEPEIYFADAPAPEPKTGPRQYPVATYYTVKHFLDRHRWLTHADLYTKSSLTFFTREITPSTVAISNADYLVRPQTVASKNYTLDTPQPAPAEAVETSCREREKSPRRSFASPSSKRPSQPVHISRQLLPPARLKDFPALKARCLANDRLRLLKDMGSYKYTKPLADMLKRNVCPEPKIEIAPSPISRSSINLSKAYSERSIMSNISKKTVSVSLSQK
ncbi:uncharacterized protein LOC131942150 [Physella acuta]|uniref:uncharacterized protein LOC131942150 n=1 Tax=Physella acuta TaxID=109671 RepID=UPI0027DC785D|nr:uncharacterized protein LOC131942150 [Physella acuta]